MAARWRFASAVVVGLWCTTASLAGSARADPGENYEAPTPLPMVVATPSDWQPQFPFPFDQLRRYVTDADINAERDMCQWFNAQYYDLKGQIERLNNTIVRNNGDFNGDGVAQQVDIVTANIDQALDFLAPRAQSLTQSYDHAGDMYFPIYQGDSFYGLWQQISNVGNGLRARQPTWFTGPSFARAQHWGSKINRSHVCR
ncbi:hypothetical protein [Mycobacterium sp. DL592]|uniref:hypothetical protein n=1 Tax=Mycobacterium sp. DL592 TaxID=2675524 RepID=UPI00352F3DA3